MGQSIIMGHAQDQLHPLGQAQDQIHLIQTNPFLNISLKNNSEHFYQFETNSSYV